MGTPITDVVAAGGFTMSYSVVGSGPTVICLHSGGLSSRQWRRLQDRLAARWRVALADFIGYGASSPLPEAVPFRIDCDTALVEALVDRLGEPVHVVGHSYGGLIGLRLALRRPKNVRSLALFEPVAFSVLFDGQSEQHVSSLPWLDLDAPTLAPTQREAWLSEFVDWWTGPGAWTRIGDDVRGSFRAVAGKLYREVRSLIADRTTARDYGRIEASALLMDSRESPASSRRIAELLAAAMPNARLHEVAGGHMAPVSDARAVNAEIEAFLEENR